MIWQNINALLIFRQEITTNPNKKTHLKVIIYMNVHLKLLHIKQAADCVNYETKV